MELITVAPAGCAVGELVLNNDAANSAWFVATASPFDFSNTQKIELMTWDARNCFISRKCRIAIDYCAVTKYLRLCIRTLYWLEGKAFARQNNEYYLILVSALENYDAMISLRDSLTTTENNRTYGSYFRANGSSNRSSEFRRVSLRVSRSPSFSLFAAPFSLWRISRQGGRPRR